MVQRAEFSDWSSVSSGTECELSTDLNISEGRETPLRVAWVIAQVGGEKFVLIDQRQDLA